SGQRCDAISRVLVVECVAEAFLKKLKEEVAKVKSGDPWDEDVVVGPLINERALRKVDELVKDALDKGAELIIGGNSEGLLYYPTVLDNVPLDSRIAWEETFGPVIPIIRVKDLDEALVVANKSRYGLDSCVFTTSIYKAWRAIKLLEVGTVTVNDFPAHGIGNFPFGGIKDSGIGREGLGYSIDELTVLKTISINIEPSGLRKE
ncbi:MAG: aldehyde dehydrogenase family protein, partial [Thermoproteota archaeon]